MTAPKVNWEINVGTILHLVVLLGSILILYGEFSTQFEQTKATVDATQRQVTRIEKYLSSQDNLYWQKVNEYGDK